MVLGREHKIKEEVEREMICPLCGIGELFTVQNSKDSSDASLFKPVEP